jgi:dTDP-4-dehydrorhamnose reductase
MKVAVIGGDGQLGTDVVPAFASPGDAVFSVTHIDIELSSLESVRTSLGKQKVDVVVNKAAMHHPRELRATARQGIRR